MQKFLFLCSLGLLILLTACPGPSGPPGESQTAGLEEFSPALVNQVLERFGIKSRARTIRVQVRGSLDDLEVMVRPWRITVPAAGDAEELEWQLLDPHNLVTGIEINNDGKSCGEYGDGTPGPHGFPEKKPPPNATVHGPFDRATPTNGWCKYNIVLHTAEGDVVVDPDYRVGPGTPGGIG